MQVSKAASLFTPQKTERLIQTLTWVAPAAVIPTLRFVQDTRQRPEMSKELFVRDFTTYSIGAALFLGLSIASEKLYQSLKLFKGNNNKIKFAAFMTGLVPYLLYSGIGALKIAEKFKTKRETVFASSLNAGNIKLDAHERLTLKGNSSIPLIANFGNQVHNTEVTTFNSNNSSQFGKRGNNQDVFKIFKIYA
jgi:hypothetical protein